MTTKPATSTTVKPATTTTASTTKASTTTTHATASTNPQTTTTKPETITVLPPTVATDISSGKADIGGDGKPDTACAYVKDGKAFVAADLSSGKKIATEVQMMNSVPPTMLGAMPIGGTGSTIFLELEKGASTDTVALYHLQGGSLVALTEVGGKPADFAISAAGDHLSGLRCPADKKDLEVLQADSRDGKKFDTNVTTFQLSGTALTQVGSVKGTATSPADKTKLTPFGEITCGSITLSK